MPGALGAPAVPPSSTFPGSDGGASAAAGGGARGAGGAYGDIITGDNGRREADKACLAIEVDGPTLTASFWDGKAARVLPSDGSVPVASGGTMAATIAVPKASGGRIVRYFDNVEPDARGAAVPEGVLLGAAAVEVPLATFDGADGTVSLSKWVALVDPVMGGQSTGKWTVNASGYGTLDAEVKDVPSLKAPGFATAGVVATYPDAVSLISKIGAVAEEIDHHPDINVVHLCTEGVDVVVKYQTYEVGCVTEKVSNIVLSMDC